MKHYNLISDEKLERLIEERSRKNASEAHRDYERELLMKQANISVLQSQINPHFLYNTLECIRGQALMHNEPDIASMAKALSLFFRYSISGNSDVVTVEEEIDSIRNYLLIQQYRFVDRFETIYMIEDEEILKAQIPKLTLQPILENAVIHGLSERTCGGRLCIHARKLQHHISIEISDNGKGMTTEEVNRLYAAIKGEEERHAEKDGGAGQAPKPTAGSHTGLGLRNVDRRLRLIFGEEYGISVNSAPGMGTVVEIFLPMTERN